MASLVVIAAAGLQSLPGTVGPSEEYRIATIKAQLFYSDRGTFSDDIIGRPNLALWNTIIGEGDGGGPSRATLVVVEVAGAPGSFDAKRRVRLFARRGRTAVLDRAQRLSVLNPKGLVYVGFWLYDTGCAPLSLTAVLIGQRTPASRTATIPFSCGE